MDLIDLLDWARQVGCISKDAWNKGHRVRKYRNSVTHPDVDLKKIVRKYPKAARLVREMKTDRDRFIGSDSLRTRMAFRFTSLQLAEDVVADVHSILQEIYTRGPFRGGTMMSLITGKDVAQP
jgi:hypothetical protein